jgi:hypothetical protein
MSYLQTVGQFFSQCQWQGSSQLQEFDCIASQPVSAWSVKEFFATCPWDGIPKPSSPVTANPGSVWSWQVGDFFNHVSWIYYPEIGQIPREEYQSSVITQLSDLF